MQYHLTDMHHKAIVESGGKTRVWQSAKQAMHAADEYKKATGQNVCVMVTGTVYTTQTLSEAYADDLGIML